MSKTNLKEIKKERIERSTRIIINRYLIDLIELLILILKKTVKLFLLLILSFIIDYFILTIFRLIQWSTWEPIKSNQIKIFNSIRHNHINSIQQAKRRNSGNSIQFNSIEQNYVWLRWTWTALCSFD